MSLAAPVIATAVAARGLGVSYGATLAVDDLDLDVAPGGWLAIIGPNGAGKTSVLRALAGLVEHRGELWVGGRPRSELARRQLARVVAYVPQRPVVPPDMSVFTYVMLGRTPYHGWLGAEGGDDRRIVADALHRLDLDDLAGRPLAAVSGGELQRAVLARAVAQRADVLLLDEPTSALDLGHQQSALEQVDRLRCDHGLTIVSTLHDLTLAGQFADQVVLLANGRAVARGAPGDVLTEEIIATHYGADVRVVTGSDGEVWVLPVRR
ncbi:MAG TPA: ABC transporter ATP-binding protein [Acidimicrobiales bacterium]|nr:ABC transporter ATP-binding protein [Acidimicrobiales bacterium]